MKWLKFTLFTSDLWLRTVQWCGTWHSSLTRGEELEIERIQKCALRIILSDDYDSNGIGLKVTNLETLKDRRKKLCMNFAKKYAKNGGIDDIFILHPIEVNSRWNEKYIKTSAMTSRLSQICCAHYAKIAKQLINVYQQITSSCYMWNIINYMTF